MTVLEIMIVVAIISILAGIAAYAISGIREKVWKEQAKQELERIAVAIEQLAFDTGKWPGGLRRTTQDKEVWDLGSPESGLLTNPPGTASGGTMFGQDWRGPYINATDTNVWTDDTIPYDRRGQPTFLDPWGKNYFFDSDYNIRNAGTSIVVAVGCFGPNGVGQNKYDEDDLWVEIRRR
jgi:type II secretory pathway pseudopilin PulG